MATIPDIGALLQRQQVMQQLNQITGATTPGAALLGNPQQYGNTGTGSEAATSGVSPVSQFLGTRSGGGGSGTGPIAEAVQKIPGVGQLNTAADAVRNRINSIGKPPTNPTIAPPQTQAAPAATAMQPTQLPASTMPVNAQPTLIRRGPQLQMNPDGTITTSQ